MLVTTNSPICAVSQYIADSTTPAIPTSLAASTSERSSHPLLPDPKWGQCLVCRRTYQRLGLDARAKKRFGTYTVNERRADYYEAYRKDSAVQHAMAEYNRTGKMSNFYTEVQACHRPFPPIEQAQLLANYEMDL